MITLMPEVLSLEEIEHGLMTLPGWSFEHDSLKKEFLFDNFVEAMGFIVKVGIEAEKLRHHPELFNVYNKVIITLRTHDAGDKVSEKDLGLASKIESLVQL